MFVSSSNIIFVFIQETSVQLALFSKIFSGKEETRFVFPSDDIIMLW